ncbi:MAG: hypothetical protein R2762_15155 [Bryobacteraceae bacterium]
MRRRHFLALPAAALGAVAAPGESFHTRQVKVDIAFRAPCPVPNGLQATEEGLWILNQGGDNALYLVDWDGNLKEKLNTDSVAGSGVGWDGAHLWIASTYDHKVLKVDRISGKTLAAYETPGAGVVNWPNPRKSPLVRREPAAARPETRESAAPAPPPPDPNAPRPVTGAHGVEFKYGKLYLAVPPSASIYRINPANFQVEFQWKTAGDRPHGLGWEGKDLWCVDSNANAIFKYDVSDGNVIGKIQLGDRDPLPHGMTIRNGVLWYCDDVGVVCRLNL